LVKETGKGGAIHGLVLFFSWNSDAGKALHGFFILQILNGHGSPFSSSFWTGTVLLFCCF
jgi:hypothetical protein